VTASYLTCIFKIVVQGDRTPDWMDGMYAHFGPIIPWYTCTFNKMLITSLSLHTGWQVKCVHFPASESGGVIQPLSRLHLLIQGVCWDELSDIHISISMSLGGR
jgi:hypothetical protein